MANRKTPSTDRGSIPAQIAIHHQHIESAQAEHAAQSLALMRDPEDKELQRVVDGLEAEVAQHHKTIARLQAAQIAADKEQTVEDKQAAADLHNDRAAKVSRLSSRAAELAARLVESLEGVAPDLAELQVVLAERQQLVWATLSAALGSKDAARRYSSALMALTGHHEVGAGITNALAASGLGTTIPLTPGVIISPPAGAPYTASTMQANLARRARQIDTLIKGVAPAAEVLA